MGETGDNFNVEVEELKEEYDDDQVGMSELDKLRAE